MNPSSTRKELLQYGSWLFVLHTIIAIPISFLYLRNIELSTDFFTLVYLIILTVSHFAFLFYVIFGILYVPLLLIIPKKKVLQVFAVIIISFSFFILLIDTEVYKLYRFHINSFTLNLLFGGNGLEIFEFHSNIYLLGILIFAVIISLEVFILKLYNKWFNKGIFKKGWLLFFILFTLMISSHMIHAWAEAAFYKPITKSSRLYPLYFPLQASKFIYKHNIVDKENSKYRMESYFSDDNKILNYPQSPIKCSDNTKSPNILFLIIDSWHYKTMDSVITPNISKFAQKGSQFTNHSSGSNGTRTGIFSMFYSLPGLYWYDFLSSLKSPVFIDELIKRDYDFGIFASASLCNPEFDKTVFVKLDSLQLKTSGANSNLRDIQITEDWLSYTSEYDSKNNDSPFFGFLFYDSPHSISHPPDFKGPFQPEWKYAKYQELNNDTDPEKFLNLYKNSLNFVDSLIGEIIYDLQERNLLENTIVIITGDHGQEFNDNKKNYWGHNGNYSKAQLNVPLIAYWPDKKNNIYNHWTSHYDIVPTIMQNEFNCSNPLEDYSIGQNMLDTTARNWLLVGSKDNFGIVEPDRITSVYFNFSYDITTPTLDNLDDAKIRVDLFNDIMKKVNSFYYGNTEP